MRTLPYKSRRLRRLVVGGAITGIVSVCGLVAALVFVPDKEAPLPGGEALCYLGATWGTRHRCVSGKRWQRALLSVIARPDLFGGQVTEMPTSPASLVVWARGRGRFRSLRWYGDGGSPLRFEAVDQHGCRFGSSDAMLQPDSLEWWRRPTNAAVNLRALFNGGDGLLYTALPAFPRRPGGKWLDVVPAWDGSVSGAPVARFRLDTPAFAVGHSWHAEPCPIDRTAMGVHFRCLGISHPKQTACCTGNREPPGTLLSQLNYRADGRGGTWRAVRIDTSDETGNEQSTPEAVEYPDSLFDGLCLRETAWKMRATLLPVGSKATPDDVWHLRLPVPTRGTQVTLGKAWSSGPIHLVARQVYGVGGFIQNDGHPNLSPMLEMTWSATAPFKMEVLRHPGNGSTVEGADTRRKDKAPVPEVYDPTERTPEPILIPLPESENVSVQLTVNFWQSRRVEFYAKP